MVGYWLISFSFTSSCCTFFNGLAQKNFQRILRSLWNFCLDFQKFLLSQMVNVEGMFSFHLIGHRIQNVTLSSTLSFTEWALLVKGSTSDCLHEINWISQELGSIC